MLGNDQTLAGISDSLNRGIIENAEQETGITNLATLTINNTADCAYKRHNSQRRSGSQRRQHRAFGAGEKRSRHADAQRL